MAIPVLQTNTREETLWTCWTASTLDCTAAFHLPNFHGPAKTHIDVAVEHGLKVIRNDLGYLINQAHQEAAHSVVSRHFSRLSTKQRLSEALSGTAMVPAGPQAVSLPASPPHVSPAHPQRTAVQCSEHPGCELTPLLLAVGHLRVQSPGWG